MKIYIFIILIFFYSSQLFSNSLFDTDFYEIKFQSNNVDQTKLDKINELQLKSITKILLTVACLRNSIINEISDSEISI